MRRLLFPLIALTAMIVFVSRENLRAENYLYAQLAGTAAVDQGIDEVNSHDASAAFSAGFRVSVDENRKQYASFEYEHVTFTGTPRRNLAINYHEYFAGGKGWDLGIHGGPQFELNDTAKNDVNVQFGFSALRDMSSDPENRWVFEGGLVFDNVVDGRDYATLFVNVLFLLEKRP